MADLVSPIVDIISRLWPCCARHTRYLCKMQENKDLLRTAMDKLNDAKNDVQRRVIEEEADPNEPKKRTDSVSRWLQSVEKIEGEVEVILQKANEQQLSSRGRCLGGCCPPNNNCCCWSNYKLGKSIAKKILPFVDELKVNGKFEEVTYRLPPPPVQPMNLESTVGMESMFDKVWKHITSKDDNKGKIIGLYGHGGVGKTTLLKKINNEFDKICGEHGFDHIVIFVVVSKPINYEAIQNKIGEKLGLSFQRDGDESSRADKIFNQLRNKFFVILLDDIWERVDLQRIGIPSPLTQDNSSKVVIFTTRNEEVCGLMEARAPHKFQVECLPWDKAWRLFQDKVGNETLYSHPGIPELAGHVAKECDGLPLALITIGRAMSTKKSVEEWKDAITTLRKCASEFQGMSDEVLPRLKLSYDYLRSDTIKSCFLYCALYPEDYSIMKSELIEYWIGEGFLSGFDNLDETRNHGHTVIETLKRACLLESVVGNNERFVKMHDVIRDLALWIVNDCKSSNNDTTGKFLVATSNVCERWRNAERIFWNSRMEVEEPPISPNLRTLLVLQGYAPNSQFSLPQSFFQFTPFLRVLDMSDTQLTEVPRSICELYELQYLNLSRTYIKELPIELRKLVKLKFLDLSYADDLVKIPSGVIANLYELQVLKLRGSGVTDWVLKEEEEEDCDGGLSLGELDRLKQLQEITLNISTSLALEELLCNQKLPRICTTLTLKSRVNLKSISLLPPPSMSMSTTSKVGLGNLITLKDLDIDGCVELEELILFINDEGGETNTTTTTTSAAAAAGLPISNNNKLEKLCLVDLPRLNNIVWGEKYHHYMAAKQQQPPFQNLHTIYISGCGALKDLAWVVYVENLKKFHVAYCKGLETIIELGDAHGLEEGASGGGRVVFRKLKTLLMYDLPNLKSICSHALGFPSIQTIWIRECPELKKLPLDSRSNINNTLQHISGESYWWSELKWEDETIKSKFHPYYEEVY